MTAEDIEYYRVRELSERAAMEQAQCSASRNAHLQLAERYADQIGSLEERQVGAQQR